VRVVVARDRQTATGTLFVSRARRRLREGLGCALAIGASPDALRSAALPPRAAIRPAAAWPDGDADEARQRAPRSRACSTRRSPRARTRRRSARAQWWSRAPAASSPSGTRRILARHPAAGLVDGEERGRGASGSLARTASSRWSGRRPRRVRAPGDPRARSRWRNSCACRAGSRSTRPTRTRCPTSSRCSRRPATPPASPPPSARAPAGTRFAYASGTTNVLMQAMREALADDRAYLALRGAPVRPHRHVERAHRGGRVGHVRGLVADVRHRARLGALGLLGCATDLERPPHPAAAGCAS